MTLGDLYDKLDTLRRMTDSRASVIEEATNCMTREGAEFFNALVAKQTEEIEALRAEELK